ncbi:MAG: hypothetical protein JWM88_1883 [Verrucomicrobia bacterium]|nr:hypothetical protein [Verrucomicrobiota bacterium]
MSFRSQFYIFARLCGAAGLLSFCPARASTVLVTQDVDLGTFINLGYDMHFSSAPVVNVTNGADIMVTFNFLYGDRLVVNNSSSSSTWFSTGWPWLESKGVSGDFAISNIQISLVSPSVVGTADTSLSLTSQIDGKVHLGPVAAFDVEAYSSVSFIGVTATYHVDSVPGGSNTYQPWIYGYFNTLGVVAASSGGAASKTGEAVNQQMTVCYDQSVKNAASWAPPSPIITDFGSSPQSVPDGVATGLLLAGACATLFFFGQYSRRLAA